MDKREYNMEEGYWVAWNTGSYQKLTEFYDEHADIYEKYITSHGFAAPLELAKAVAELYPTNRENIRILDVAAGTGLAAKEMSKCGFKLMDALDPSEKMLDEARKNGLYDRYICDYVGSNKLDIPNETYDLITICGSILTLVNSDYGAGMRELIRISKPGAYFVMTTRRNFFSYDEEPKTDVEIEFGKIEQEGLWEFLSKRKIDYLDIVSGVIAILRKK